MSKLDELLSTLSYAKNVVESTEEKHDLELDDLSGYLDNIKYDLGELADEYDGLHKKVKGQKDRIEYLEEEISDLEKYSIEEFIPQELRNIRMVAALQAIVDNISYINVAELEALANKTPMLPAAY